MSRTLRAPYRKSRRYFASCRSHGGCPYCEGNRMHRHFRWLARAMASLRDWFTEEDT